MAPAPSLTSINNAYEEIEPIYIKSKDGVVVVKDSDGDASHLPEEGEQETSGDSINILSLAEDEAVKQWLSKLGNYLIYEGDWHSLSRQRTYRLLRFPTNYKLYCHKTGDAENPRRDHYLFGSSTCIKFRSPEEFALHLKWLGFGRPRDSRGRPLCGCKYCSKRSQGEISAMLWSKTSHLHAEPSTRSSAGRRTAETSYIDHNPIIAKDYTRLNQSESVTV